MILSFMTKDERRAGRRKNLINHIDLLKKRHSKDKRHRSIQLLKKLLSQIPNEKDDLQTESKI